MLLSFVGDVYCDSSDSGATRREALKLLCQYNVPVAVLSKGGSKMLEDLELFKQFGSNITVGVTLTFMDEAKSQQWEPYAATPQDRLLTLKTLHDNGISTFASFEPTIEPEESLALIRQTLADNSVDHYKIGKINNHGRADKWQNWQQYTRDCIQLLRPAGKAVYYKHCLRVLCPNIIFTRAECDPDYYVVRV